MNGFERRKNKKIEQIYNVSLQLFAKFGFQKVSVNEIAQHAKVSPATIYNYFGTKEQLYANMLINWMDKQLERYEAILASELSLPEKIREIMTLEAKNLNMLLDEFQKAPSTGMNGLMSRMESYSEQKVRGFFMKLVASGKQEGYIPEDQSLEMVMMYFTMYKNELRRHWEASDQEKPALDMDQLMELFFYGLAGQPQEQLPAE